MRTRPWAGSGSGTSLSSMASGPVRAVMTAARTRSLQGGQGADNRRAACTCRPQMRGTLSARATWYGAPAGRASVLTLDHEEGAADRAGELRLLPRELEAGCQFLGDLHPLGELEPDRALLPGRQAVHHVDRQSGVVEHVCHPESVDLEGRRLERPGR